MWLNVYNRSCVKTSYSTEITNRANSVCFPLSLPFTKAPMKTIKAVIFDLDGTLANTIPLCIAAFRKALEPEVKRSLSDDEIMATFGPDEEGSIKQLAPENYKETTAHFMQYYKDLHHICNHPFEGIADLLQTLKNKGVFLALATGKGKETTSLTLQHLQLTHYFDRIETGSPKGSRKPEAIQSIIDSFDNLTKEETIYVGDSKGDIKDSRKAGIKVIAAAWAETAKPDELKNEEPDELFHSIDAFANWLYANV